VCGDEKLEDVLSSLVRLVEKSLVQQDDSSEEPRYRLLETIRQYAWTKLVEHGQTQHLGERHLQYFAELADAAKPFVQEGNRSWIDRISREHDNIRFALDRFGSNPANGALGLKLAAAMTVFWNNRGHLTEARRRFQSVLLRAQSAPENLHAEALLGAAVIEASLGVYQRAVEWGETAVQMLRQLGDEGDLAFGLLVLGNIRIQLHDFDGAAEAYEEGMNLRVRRGETDRLAIPLNNLGYVEYQRGNLDKAQRMIEEAIDRSRKIGNHQIIVNASHSLAMVYKDQGKLEEALTCMRDSLKAAAELQHHAPIALRLEGIAYILQLLNENRTATQLIAAADTIRKKINLPVPSLERPHHERHIEALRMATDDYEAEFEKGSSLSEAEAIDLALGTGVAVR
jgi:tetratricopeptide (TPR) repeat protein